MRISDWSSDVCSSDLKRLILISAGNTITDNFGAGDYLDICDHPDHEIESPAQAWNAICVGACTEKTVLPQGQPGCHGGPVTQFADGIMELTVAAETGCRS